MKNKKNINETSNITIPEGFIIDFIDGTFRKDNPEEYVRQQIERSIVKEYSYPKEIIKIENSVKLGSQRKRVDIAIFDEDENKFKQEDIKIIIECKKETISPNHKSEGVEQLKSYMSACVNCDLGVWTNSKDRFVFRKITGKKIKFEEIIDIPKYGKTLDEAEKPKLQDLVEATGDNLKFNFKRCHDYIAGNQGLQKPEAFWELLKIIFCKIYDERSGELSFYVTSEERKSLNGQLTLKKRIDKIFSEVIEIEEYASVFKENEKIELEPRVSSFIISQLQNYSLLESSVDVKGAAYEEIVGSNLRGDRGEFFTPRNVCEMIVKMINPKINETILDPACGTGGFLTIAMSHVLNKIKDDIKKRWRDRLNPTYNERNLLFNSIKKYTENNIFGIDLNPNLVKATKMNMVMNNDGSGTIHQTNSLINANAWREELRIKLKIKSSSDINKFDVIVTNPPFGTKIPVDDPIILEQYDLGYLWEKENENRYKTKKLQKSVPPEILFIERCVQMLKENGRLAIVLPDAILGAPGLQYVRYWILRNTQVLASIDLDKDTFQPKNGTQTSVLFLRKKTKKEIELFDQKKKDLSKPIFAAMVTKVGHDKRGNTIFKRDNKGNEVLKTKKEIVKKDVNGKITEAEMSVKEKIIDDETDDIANIFNEWKNNKKNKYKEFDF